MPPRILPPFIKEARGILNGKKSEEDKRGQVNYPFSVSPFEKGGLRGISQ